MPERNLEITIAPDGTVTASISGYHGPKCQELAKYLSELLGTEISFAPSAEFYEQNENEINQDLQNGY